MSDVWARLGRWLSGHATWQNVVRTTGLFGMMFLVLTKDHPDATALIVLGTMIGLPTFIGLSPTNQQEPPRSPPRPQLPKADPPASEDETL